MIPLIEAREKVRRADKHFSDLEAEVATWRATDSHALPIEGRLDGEWFVAFYREPLPIIGSALICGDFVQNLRTALDYAVCEIASAFTGAEPTKRNQFPIYSSEDDFTAQVRNCKPVERSPLFGVPIDSPAWTIIEGAQPYKNRGNIVEFEGTRFDVPTDLESVASYSNRDKHRALHVQIAMPLDVTSYPASFRFRRPELVVESLFGIRQDPGIEGTEIARFRLDPRGEDPEMYVDPPIAFDQTFGDGVQLAHLQRLTNMRDVVSGLLDSLGATSGPAT
jgi:hypothetical protein